MRVSLLIVLGLNAVQAIRDHPVTDTMEGIGNTAGTVQGGVSDAGSTVGADKVGEGAGSVVTGAGDAVGGAAGPVVDGAAGTIGAKDPDHVGVVGGGTVPTALKCVINLTIQYLGVYTALAILRVVAEFQGENVKSWTIGESLGQAVLTVNYAPMAAIMFLACRMRVTWLTQGKGNPPESVQMWMYAITYSILALTLVALCVPLL